MTLICYSDKMFAPATRKIILLANEIIAKYARQGFTLTLRQLYYQFVARDLLPNTQRSYKRLGAIISDGRRAGLIHWESIEDRTRNVQHNPHWDSIADIMRSAAKSFALDKWEGQEHRVEVWIEKDALLGVIEPTCRKWDVDYFSCRGYVSDSEIWRAAQRLHGHWLEDQNPVILHLADHDPSGIDMTRDIRDRLALFTRDFSPEVRRIALTREQIDQYDPPPNPAKVTDSRYEAYCLEHGDESWELDALEPAVLAELIGTNVEGLLDFSLWERRKAAEGSAKDRLTELADEEETS